MKELSQIIDLKKIKVINKPIDKAHGLPNECYTDVDYLSIERKKIFENKWVVIGVGSSVPNIGDAKPFDLLGIPLIILRDKNKKIKGLDLTETLNNYAQTGSEYTKILNQIIKQNRLMDFEPVRLVNSVKKIELSS